jgi:hypothetical protein
MAEHSKLHADLWQQFYQGSDVDDILHLLEKVKGLQKSAELSTKEVYELQIRAFLTLKDLTVESSARAEQLILTYLLPECLRHDKDVSYELYQHRECLEDWLNQYPESKRSEIRDKVLEQLYPRLKSSEPLPACWLVSQIGYRTDEAVDALWDIVRSDNGKVGDTALATLASLGIEESQRKRILEELHRRAVKGYKQTLASAMIHLADPSSVEVVYRSWLRSPEHELSSMQRLVAFSVLMQILDAHNNDKGLQDQIWRWLADLVDVGPPELSRELYLSQMGPNCDSALVIPTMLEWLGKSTGSSWNHYVIGLRLEECVRPRQLKGWSQPPSPPVIEILQREACQNTGSDGVWTTKEDMVKTKAWEMALRAGRQEALGWFEAAVLPEESRFMQKRVVEWFSCFRFASLPDIIYKWITEEFDWTIEGKDSRELSRRMAATRMARSSASCEAFEALVDFGLNAEGKAMMQSVYALTEVALSLIREGETQVIDKLVETVVHQRKGYQRSAAAYAIERIADSFPQLLLSQVDRIIPAIRDEERKPYERSSLIRTVAYLEDWELPADLVMNLEKWADRPDKWIGGSSLEVLGYHGYLWNNQDLLGNVLGLQQVEGKWDLDKDASRSDWAPYIVGLLYYKHRAPFVPAIVSMVETLDSLSIPQVYEWLLHSPNSPSRPELPEAIKDALIQRVYETQTSVHSETQVFQVLGEMVPEALAQEDWSNSWDNWLSDSRVALADALGKAQLKSNARNKGISQLQLLTADGQYMVRRSAYRALSRQSMETLLRLCLSWLESSFAELRQRAAEGCGWLDCKIEEDGSDTFENLYQELAADPEKSVREAAKRAWKERRERSWANEYLSVILRVKGDTNEEILKSWCYGEALARIGDDTCIHILREHLSQGSPPPNVRYWSRQIVEKMEENWRKTTQDWPEPWFAWEGSISEGQGKLVISENKVLEINYSIWAQPHSAPLAPAGSTWGGAMWPLPFPTTHDLEAAIIELQDGRRGRLLIKRVSGEKAIFIGSGHYPEQL